MPRYGSALAPNQFGDRALTTAEAYSACGPAAAVAFARLNGRNPTLSEALEIAKGTGWTAGGGMNGVHNQKRLLDKMGIPHQLETAADARKIVEQVASGRPVIISTAAHYYVADDYDPATGKVHVGNTGLARKGGGAWMTVDEIARKDQGINGAIYFGGTPVAHVNQGTAGSVRSPEPLIPHSNPLPEPARHLTEPPPEPPKPPEIKEAERAWLSVPRSMPDAGRRGANVSKPKEPTPAEQMQALRAMVPGFGTLPQLTRTDEFALPGPGRPFALPSIAEMVGV